MVPEGSRCSGSLRKVATAEPLPCRRNLHSLLAMTMVSGTIPTHPHRKATANHQVASAVLKASNSSTTSSTHHTKVTTGTFHMVVRAHRTEAHLCGRARVLPPSG